MSGLPPHKPRQGTSIFQQLVQHQHQSGPTPEYEDRGAEGAGPLCNYTGPTVANAGPGSNLGSSSPTDSEINPVDRKKYSLNEDHDLVVNDVLTRRAGLL